MNHIDPNLNIGPPRNLSIHGPGVRDISRNDQKPPKSKPGTPTGDNSISQDSRPWDDDLLDIEKFIEKNQDKASLTKQSGSAGNKSNSIDITIMHTNDLHGNIEPTQETDPSCPEGKTKSVGGAGQMAAIINDERKKASDSGDHFLLVDAGDMAMGTPISGIFKGEPVIEVMNRQGYDAATIGNHEFDWGIDPLKNIIAQADFPFVSANITDAEGSSLPRVKPFIIKDMGDVKVGIVGVTTPETPIINANDDVKNLRFEDPAKVLRETIPEMKKQGADIVVVLSHMGYREDHKLAGQVEGIDLIVGGHSHNTIETPVLVGNTAIVQTGCNGRTIGKVRLRWNPRTQSVVGVKGNLMPVNSDNVNPDSQIQSIVKQYQKATDAMMDKKLGQLDTDLVHPETGEETNLGNMVTDLMRSKTGAEIALINSTSLRANLPRGDVTFKDVYRVFPFDSSIVKINMKGSDILDALESSAGEEKDRRLQVSGLNITYDSTRPEGSRMMEVSTQDGNPLNPDKTYSVATIDYLLVGGDHYDMFTRSEPVDVNAGNLKDEMARELTSQSHINSMSMGRVRDMAM